MTLLSLLIFGNVLKPPHVERYSKEKESLNECRETEAP